MSGDKSLKNVVIGFVIGVGSILPGVSGGILAVGFGVYERLVTAVGNILERLRPDFWFLLTLGAGIVAGMGVTAFGLNYAFGHYTSIMMCLFLGLVAGQVPDVWKLAKGGEGVRPLYAAMAVIGFAVMIVFLPFESASSGAASYPDDLTTALIFMFCGFVMAMAKVVPGLSGTAILLAMGLFTVSLEKVTSFDPLVIISLGIGFAIGILLFAKLMAVVLERYPRQTYYLIFGLTLGSLLVIFFSTSIVTATDVVLGIAAAAVGLLISWAFTKYGGSESDGTAGS